MEKKSPYLSAINGRDRTFEQGNGDENKLITRKKKKMVEIV